MCSIARFHHRSFVVLLKWNRQRPKFIDFTGPLFTQAEKKSQFAQKISYFVTVCSKTPIMLKELSFMLVSEWSFNDSSFENASGISSCDSWNLSLTDIILSGHETKAMLNNNGPRYKRSTLEKQMNTDIMWCVVILLVLCAIGSIGCYVWLSSFDDISNDSIPFLPKANVHEWLAESFLTFCVFIIILQVRNWIPTQLLVLLTIQLCYV